MQTSRCQLTYDLCQKFNSVAPHLSHFQSLWLDGLVTVSPKPSLLMILKAGRPIFAVYTSASACFRWYLVMSICDLWSLKRSKNFCSVQQVDTVVVWQFALCFSGQWYKKSLNAAILLALCFSLVLTGLFFQLVLQKPCHTPICLPFSSSKSMSMDKMGH